MHLVYRPLISPGAPITEKGDPVGVTFFCIIDRCRWTIKISSSAVAFGSGRRKLLMLMQMFQEWNYLLTV
jgi:hypothetical protein